jgi:glycine/D-amino acid oxidase-like deaminating enzyme
MALTPQGGRFGAEPLGRLVPQYARVGILNGTGAKGVTLAPYFARQLAESLVNSAPILPGADVARLARVLQRG